MEKKFHFKVLVYLVSAVLTLCQNLLFHRYFSVDIEHMCKSGVGFLEECKSTAVLTEQVIGIAK